MSEHKEYSIGEKMFIQEKLAWRQIKLVLAQVEGLSVLNLSPMGIVAALGTKLSAVLGVILFPRGETRLTHMDRLKDPNKFLEHVNHLEDWLELDASVEVLRDFLFLNRISYVYEVLEGIQKILDKDTPAETTSNGSVPSSPAATQPIETASST